MELKDKFGQFYRDMTIHQLRIVNFSCYAHVSYNSLLYLDLIAYTENCTVSRLADMLHVAKSAVTQKVKELERLGLVVKTQSTTDKRVFYLHINDAVRRDYASYDRIFDQALHEIQQSFSEQEIAAMSHMMDTIHQHFIDPIYLKGESSS